MNTKTHTIFFPYALTSKLRDIQEILSSISKLRDCHNESIILDFSHSKFIASEMTPLIDLVISYFERKNNIVKINTDSLRLNVRNILSKNNFLKHHNLVEKKLYDTNNTTISYTSFTLNGNNDHWNSFISDYLKENVFNNSHWPRENDKIAMSKIKESIVEIIDNIVTHSNSEKIILCGQYYPKKNKLNFSILDTGDGIPKIVSLLPENIGKSDSKKIDWATQEGTTTTNELTSKTARGIGLSTIREELAGFGEFTILSKKGYWKVTSGLNGNQPKIITQDLPFGLHGTLIHITFFLDKLKDESSNTTINDIDFSFEELFEE